MPRSFDADAERLVARFVGGFDAVVDRRGRFPVAVLRRWKAEGWVRWIGYRPEPSEPVFARPVTVDGEKRALPWYAFDSAPWLRADLEAVGCSSTMGGHAITFHALRRTFATWLHAASVDEKTRGDLMGHAGKSVTSRHYTAADLERMRAAVASIALDLALGEVVALPLRKVVNGPEGADQTDAHRFGSTGGSYCGPQ